MVDQLRDDGKRPSVDTENADLPLVVYLDRGRALLYRSLSGTRSMHKRGYRDAMHAASLKENVAAGLLLASGWDPETQGDWRASGWTLLQQSCGWGPDTRVDWWAWLVFLYSSLVGGTRSYE